MPQVKPRDERFFKYIDFEIPNGFFFAPLRKNYGKVKLAHPLDNVEEMLTLLNEKIIPICTSYCSGPEFFGKHVKEVIQHMIPSFDPCFTFPVELLYLLIIPKEQQTKENLELAKILRILCEMYFGSASILDDIADNSLMRMGKPTWHTICKGGLKDAVYDAIYLDKLAYHILDVFFGDTPGYKNLLKAFNGAFAVTCIGQLVENLGTSNLRDGEINVNPYKSGFACEFFSTFGLMHSGITDEAIIVKVGKIISEVFIGMQAWNDFNDTFSTFNATGKYGGEDIQNGRATWSCQAALVLFNEEQKAKFLKCYGSTNESNIQMIKDLYAEVNMPGKYLEFMTKRSNNIDCIIKEIPREDVKKACTNIKEWFFGKIKNIL